MEPKNEVDTESLAAPGVLEKFKTAGKIATTVMDELIKKAVPEADIYELCMFGNKRINEECSKVYSQKKIPKGVAFPVSISPNDLCGYLTPIKDESFALKDGDLAKINLGVHIDGFPVELAHSFIVGSTTDEAKLRALSSGYVTLETGVKHMKPGNKNNQVTQAFTEVSEAYKTQTLEGVLSHYLRRYCMDSNDVIILKECSDQKVAEYEFKVNDIFALEVFVTAHETEGKTKESELRTTVFKQIPDATHDVKTKSAKRMINEVNNKFFGFGFALNDFDDVLVS